MRRVEANTAGTIHRSLELRQVVRTRESLLGSSLTELAHTLSIGIGNEQMWTAEWCLLHDRGVAELLDESFTTLNRGVGNFRSFGRAEAGPATMFNAVDERDHAMDITEIDEGIAHIAAGLEINSKVDKVISAEADIIENGLEGHLGRMLEDHSVIQ